MRLERETGLGFTAMLLIQLTSSALAVALLARMGPAIGLILEENVYSGEAVEDMLAELAEAEREPGPAKATPEFDDALQRARSNVTEDEEVPLLDAITADRVAAFGGDAEARLRLIHALRQLGRVNRDSMRRADAAAQRLGIAGAWAAVLLAGLSLTLGIVAYRRLRVRLELPIVALRETTRRIRAGNWHARCPPVDAPREIEQIALDINWMLDQDPVGGPGAADPPN